MGEDGARGKDWLRARGHHLCLTDTIFLFFKILMHTINGCLDGLAEYLQVKINKLFSVINHSTLKVPKSRKAKNYICKMVRPSYIILKV